MMIPTALTPYTFWIKFIGILLVVAAIAGGGYKIGSAIAHNADSKAYQDLANQKDELQKEFDGYKIQVANTKAKANADAAQAILDRDQANKASQDAKQAQITALQQKLQTTLKEVQNAKQAALTANAHPVVTADPTTDGMWVDVQAGTCSPSDSNSGGSVPSATSGGLDSSAAQRCRLHQSTASRLVFSAAQANEVVAQLNTCISTLKTAIAPTGAEKTVVNTDTQGATQ